MRWDYLHLGAYEITYRRIGEVFGSSLKIGCRRTEFDLDGSGHAVANDCGGEYIAYSFLRDSPHPGIFTVNGFAVDGDNQVSSDSEFDVADIDDLGSASDPGGFFGGTAYDVLYE
jgi:hypothetical protein